MKNIHGIHVAYMYVFLICCILNFCLFSHAQKQFDVETFQIYGTVYVLDVVQLQFYALYFLGDGHESKQSKICVHV